jgi:hypothetical protein
VDVQTVLIYDDRRADLGGSVTRMVATALRHELGHGALAVNERGNRAFSKQ